VLQKTSNKGIKSLDLILPLTKEFSKDKISKLLALFPVSKLEFHSVEEDSDSAVLTHRYDGAVLFTRARVTSETHCGVVDPAYFRVNKELFLESLRFNSCLYKKIAVDSNGDIKSCPSMTNSYGNVRYTTLRAAFQNQAFQELWAINKDKVNVCKYCEFRYMCTDCRAYVQDDYDKPAKCNYDPFTGKWD
jgi:SPASM domain peptide maturase of grasp-with-spasm system